MGSRRRRWENEEKFTAAFGMDPKGNDSMTGSTSSLAELIRTRITQLLQEMATESESNEETADALVVKRATLHKSHGGGRFFQWFVVAQGLAITAFCAVAGGTRGR